MSFIKPLRRDTAKEFDCKGDLITGANIAGFRKVADSMIEQGAV